MEIHWKNKWAYHYKPIAMWDINLPLKINFPITEKDATTYSQVALNLIEKTILSLKGFFRPISLEVSSGFLTASCGFESDSYLQNLGGFESASCIKEMLSEYLETQRKIHRKNLFLSSLEIEGKTSVHVYDEKTGKVINVEYPDSKFGDDKRIEWLEKLRGSLVSSSWKMGIFRMAFDFGQPIIDDTGDATGYGSFLEISTHSDIWLKKTFLVKDENDKGFDNSEIGELNDTQLTKMLKKVEEVIGGKIIDFESDYADIKNTVYEYGFKQ